MIELTNNTSGVDASYNNDELVLLDDRVKLISCEESLSKELQVQLLHIDGSHHESRRGGEQDFLLPCLEVLQIQKSDLKLLLNSLLFGKHRSLLLD